MSSAIKIFLADDHVLLRESLSNLIEEQSRYKVIGSASNGKEAIQKLIVGNLPDILILDLNMPEMDGFETAKVIYESYKSVKVLALTMYDSEIALIRLLHVGVKGFIKKDVHPRDLFIALDAIAEDGYYYAHSTTGKLANLFIRKNNEGHTLEKGMLTDMEIEFLRHVCTDMTYKQIADVLNLSPRSVDNYRDHLFDKLNVSSRVGLAMYALKNGLVAF